MAERPAEARADSDFRSFSVWDAGTDASLIDLPSIEGTGWVGDDVLMGYSAQEGRIVYFEADTGAVIEGDPIPLASERLWPGASGSRAYLANSDGTVTIVDAATGRFLEPTLDVGAAVVWVSADPQDAERAAVSRLSDGVVVTVLFDVSSGESAAEGMPGATVTEFTPDGTIVAAAGGEITVYDAISLAPLRTLPGARGRGQLAAGVRRRPDAARDVERRNGRSVRRRRRYAISTLSSVCLNTVCARRDSNPQPSDP